MRVAIMVVVFYFAVWALMYEGVRWTRCSNVCFEQRMTNEELMRTEICQNKFKRYGEHADKACVKAEVDNALSHLACTVELFWSSSEVHRIYSAYSDSYILMGAMTVIPTLYYIHRMTTIQQQQQPLYYHHQLPLQQQQQQQQHSGIEYRRIDSDYFFF